MLDGLWTVEFLGPFSMYGTGVLGIHEDRVLGGDAGYYYCGTCKQDNGNIKGELEVRRFERNSVSVFGDREEFSLTFSGEASDNEFSAIGSLVGTPGQEVTVRGKKKEDY